MTTSDLELSKPNNHYFRKQVPKDHRQSLDTRLRWLWNQRFGTIQSIYQNSDDLDDRTVASLFINAIWHKDLDSVALIFKRLEGGPVSDEEVLVRTNLPV